jgi:hypothetical protein
MEPARKLEYPEHFDRPSLRPSSTASKPSALERTYDAEGQEIQPWEIKLGKMIFYITIAGGIWFFYWFNGIQCPC